MGLLKFITQNKTYETIMIFQIKQRNEYKIRIASSPLKNNMNI